jgi:diaminopimelate epimerase
VTTLNFSKLHATGNDFLVLVDLEARLGSRGHNRLAPSLRAALCDRRRGVGADGLIRLLGGSGGADCEMELSNADGGLAEISGNGLRCLAHMAAKLDLGTGDRLVVDTAAGRREMTIRRRAEDGEVDYAEADMGLVMFTPEMIPVIADSPFDLEATVDGVTYRRGLAPARATVSVPGGDLVVDLQPIGSDTSLAVRLGGPVAFVFEVDVDLDRLADTVPLAGGVL